jgi:hypothetical protein
MLIADFSFFIAWPGGGQEGATEAPSLLIGWLSRLPSIFRMAPYRSNIGGPPSNTVVYVICKSEAKLSRKSQ